MGILGEHIMLRDTHLIIYDLDGTLIDSSRAIVRTFNEVIHEEGEPSVPHEVFRHTIGQPLPDVYRQFLPPSKHARIDSCVQRYVERFWGIAPGLTTLLDGTEDVLRHFHDRGIRQSVATTKAADVTDMLLQALGVRQYFDLIIGGRDVRNPKPHPESVVVTLERLGVEPRHAAMVGDTTYDVDAGNAAGVYTFGVSTRDSTHREKVLRSSNPSYIIRKFRSLPRYVRC